jgi:hypothetical protein
MIWHDAPCEQPVAFQIKVPQCVCQFFRDHGIPQVASARAIIEKLSMIGVESRWIFLRSSALRSRCS